MATLYLKAGERITETTQGGETANPTEITSEILSEEVITLFANIAKLQGRPFDEGDINGGSDELEITCDEDYLVGIAYVADCHTFARETDLDNFDVDRERAKMVDLFLSLMKFK